MTFSWEFVSSIRPHLTVSAAFLKMILFVVSPVTEVNNRKVKVKDLLSLSISLVVFEFADSFSVFLS